MSNSPWILRNAHPEEADTLSALAWRAKASWGYPSAWMQLWRDGLRIHPDDIRSWCVRVVATRGQAIAFFAVAPEIAELEHFWVDPAFQGKGFGRTLMEDLQSQLARLKLDRLRIVSDPQAVGFYEKFGARRVGTTASVPAGRRLPVLELGSRPAAR